MLDHKCYSINIIGRSKAKIVNFMKSEKIRHLQVDIVCSVVLMKFYSCESSVTKADFHQRPASIVFIDIVNSSSRYDKVVILDFCLSSMLLCLLCIQWLGLSFWFISKNWNQEKFGGSPWKMCTNSIISLIICFNPSHINCVLCVFIILVLRSDYMQNK